MLTSTSTLLYSASKGGYAIGAFNIYNLEGVRAVTAAAEEAQSPVMLQLHPAALVQGGTPLVTMCLEAARSSTVPISVHLDHGKSVSDLNSALDAGLLSVMADGSSLPYKKNVEFLRDMARKAHSRRAVIEGELGLLTGTEDDLTVPENLAKMTDPAQAAEFVYETGVDALAVCIGNVHGHYRGEPNLDFQRLEQIRNAVQTPLVLHGASGLPEPMIRKAIRLGISKFNVNTEVREAYINILKTQLTSAKPPDLPGLMKAAIDAMHTVVLNKICLFGSAGKSTVPK